MRQVAIAFETSGPNPRLGHRFSELVAVEQGNDEEMGRTLHLCFRTDEASIDKLTFATQFAALDEFVADAPIILHDTGLWRKFIRAELRSIKQKNARRLLNQTIDVSRWAHQRYPKHRKSVAAIATRLSIAVPSELKGLRHTAEQLRLIGTAMNSSAPRTSEKTKADVSPEP